MYKNCELTLTNYYYISITNTLALQINKNTSELSKSLNQHCHLWAHSLKSFWNIGIIFWGFQDFLIYLTKYFWALLNPPKSTFTWEAKWTHISTLLNNINFIDHSKSIKSQHLNKSRLHLTRRGTSILSTTFVREISNIFHWQYLLHSPNKNEFAGCYKSTKYKSKVFGETRETNHLKHIRRSNLNKLKE